MVEESLQPGPDDLKSDTVYDSRLAKPTVAPETAEGPPMRRRCYCRSGNQLTVDDQGCDDHHEWK
jgi:hypothetical protein